MSFKVGICFSREFKGNFPLSHIGKKLPVYLRLLSLCQQQGWQVFVLTRKTYQGRGIFQGAWQFKNNSFKRKSAKMKIDLIYDLTGGIKFPWQNDRGVKVVNKRNFKILCNSKWQTFQKIGRFMPKTFWLGEKENLVSVIPKIKTSWIVLKPDNGLKGIGVFVGSKEEAKNFSF